MDRPDHLEAERFSAPGGEPVIIVAAASWRQPMATLQAVIIGTDRDGELPAVNTTQFDLLLTSAREAPAPWVAIDAAGFERHIAALGAAGRSHPLAATIAARTLRLTEHMPLAAALDVESLAYSCLLGGAEFARWLDSRSGIDSTALPSQPVEIAREGDQVTLTLADPASRNAMTAAMRDALYEALVNLLDDPTAPSVTLQGAGKCFSTGGALSEFGSASDLAEAHSVRTLHSCARALDALGPRAEVRLHGACVGSGIEVAAAAHRRIATTDAWFQLPELAMGLMPGAGGTATIARAIGRHRTMWMLLTGKRIAARQAHDWGLVHTVVDTA